MEGEGEGEREREREGEGGRERDRKIVKRRKEEKGVYSGCFIIFRISFLLRAASSISHFSRS